MSTGSSSWITQKRRLANYAKCNFKCVYCLSQDNLTLDHLKPRSLGGSNEDTNLVCCCHSCNSSRGNSPWWEFADSDAQKRITTYRRRSTKLRRKLAGRLLKAMSYKQVMYFIGSQN